MAIPWRGVPWVFLSLFAPALVATSAFAPLPRLVAAVVVAAAAPAAELVGCEETRPPVDVVIRFAWDSADRLAMALASLRDPFVA